MRQEINDQELGKVSGGKVYVNGNTNKLCFDTIRGVFKLQNCTPYQVLEACDALIGQYATNKEYDQACYELLMSKGWITK